MLAASPKNHTVIGAAVMQLAFQRLALCVPLVLEEPGTWALGAHFFPQLATAFNRSNYPHVQKGQSHCPLGPAASAVLEELTAGERILYNAARARARAMLDRISAAAAGEDV